MRVPFVRIQTIFSAIRSAANITIEFSLDVHAADVLSTCLRQSKTILTHWTLIGPFAGMNSLVHPTFGIRMEFLGAIRATEWFDVIVNAFVAIQIGILTKRFIALFTLKRFLAGVHPFVGDVMCVA